MEGMFGSKEFDEAPAPRTHSESTRQAKEAEEYCGAECHHPENTHGIRGWCPLGLLPFFNIIWDLCPDLMHINKNLWDRCIVALFMGKRDPKKPKKNPNPGRFRDQKKHRKTGCPEGVMPQGALDARHPGSTLTRVPAGART